LRKNFYLKKTLNFENRANSVDKLGFQKCAEFLRCPKCHAELDINKAETFVMCKRDSSHRFSIIDGILSFVKREEISPEDAKWVFEYDEMAERYDEGVKSYDRWLGVNLAEEFRRVIERIPIKPTQRVLDVSTGTGSEFLSIKEAYPNVKIEPVGVDLSLGMLRVALRKFKRAGIEIPLFHTQVKELPFNDESFDVITHHGGINTFADIPAALKEWVRVLKLEGTLLVSDEGLSPTARKTQRGVKIVEDNGLFGFQPPLEHLPPQLKNVELRWIAKDTFYTITCQKLSREELNQLKTNGTEHTRIEEILKKLIAKEKKD
jgi:ubiquinone/menaquinone biosynthesis C-methylase UbiE